jgi:hypothetical protein
MIEIFFYVLMYMCIYISIGMYVYMGAVAYLVEALRHRTEGSGLDSQWGLWKFSSDLILFWGLG